MTNVTANELYDHEWQFPHGACEKGDNSQPISAILTFLVVAMLIRTLCVDAIRPGVPLAFAFSIVSQIAFEAMHAMCHAKNDFLNGGCSNYQHMIGLTMMYSFLFLSDILNKQKHNLQVPIIILVIDGMFLALGVAELWRVLIAFGMFIYVFVRATMSKAALESGSVRSWSVVVGFMVLLLIAFYIDGHDCKWLNDTYGDLPFHIVIEILGGLLFYNINRLFQKDLIFACSMDDENCHVSGKKMS
jgi:predicted outer membrane lipoprotein